MLLEAYYEPRFEDSSHGFRPGRGCHTALKTIKQKFRGTTWFIEGDIRGCFDNISHKVLLDMLSEDIHDGRLLNLMRMCLEAGYMEDWRYNHTYSGAPQGGIISPLLSNIYLHKLDEFITTELIPQYTRGKERADNPEYKSLTYRIQCARQKEDDSAVRKYAISVYHANDKLSPRTGTRVKGRSINGVIRLGIPYGLVDEVAKRYQRNGKPIHEAALLDYSDAQIIDVYQARFRGLAEYYKYAVDRCRLGKLKYVMEMALTKTLAGKFKTSVARVYRKYRGTRTYGGYTYKTSQSTDKEWDTVYLLGSNSAQGCQTWH